MVRPSFTVSEWCVTRRVSKSQFYKLKAQDLTDPLPDGRRRVPLTHNAGNKPLTLRKPMTNGSARPRHQ